MASSNVANRRPHSIEYEGFKAMLALAGIRLLTQSQVTGGGANSDNTYAVQDSNTRRVIIWVPGPAVGVTGAFPPFQTPSFSAPAVSVQATASRAAVAAVQHLCQNVSFGFSATTALTAIVTVTINLRDGATGAGTVLASWEYTLPAAVVAPFQINLSGLNIPGTAGNAMTLEFAAAVTNLMEYVVLTTADSPQTLVAAPNTSILFNMNAVATATSFPIRPQTYFVVDARGTYTIPAPPAQGGPITVNGDVIHFFDVAGGTKVNFMEID